jgi:SAM-dependent methyltransferase
MAQLARLRWVWQRRRAPKPKSTEEIFTSIFRRQAWGKTASVSGPGSDLSQTGRLVASLRNLMEAHDVRSILDIPCGDFHWMRTVNLQGLSYIGADIVCELVTQNQRYAAEGIGFRHMDLLTDPLPKVDLILCRDCLVHFSFDDIFKALRNLCASGSKYLLTTTFPTRQENFPIPTGKWRPLNLERAPFFLPPPVLILNEGCSENGGEYADKSLGLWKLNDV